ncbi:hypothetical protein ACQKNX_21345 [Lysinibacillus sp. NPDC093712]|uniref:hypothetical protein n=1 Tax=Lysinibacillus sp. NPDC093712 TaxID=3390579 RepID=UPI003D056089
MLERYRLDEITLIVASLTTPNISDYSKVGQPLITAKNLKWLAHDGDIRKLSKWNDTVNMCFKCVKVPAKTIILAKNDLGRAKKYIFQCEQEAYIANDVVAIIPNESIILSDYLYFFLHWYQPNKDWRQLHHIKLDLPALEIQTNIVKLLKTSQLLLKQKKSLLAVVEELPLHIRNISKQTEQHASHLNDGFEQLQTLYHLALHKIFTGELYQFRNNNFETKS